jgi:ribosome-associated protein
MEPVSRIPITPRLTLDPGELSFSFIRASGPGGQNVNKVATAVQLRFDALHSPSLPAPVIRRLLSLAGRRATIAGEIVITAQRFRTQEANRKDAVERLVALIEAATHVPKPRVATRPSRAAKRRRVDNKKRRAATKRDRRVGPAWD